MFKRMMVVLMGVVFMVVPAFAGNTPTFDAVGNDATNFFAARDFIKQLVVANNFDTFQNAVEANSNFTTFCFAGLKWEAFSSNGSLQADPCFPEYSSYLASPGRTVNYTWRIVLQYQPESDLNVNILDCVMKHNERNPFFYADQTGYYRNGDAVLAFKLEANPKVTVRAYAGVNSVVGTPGSMMGTLVARQIPGLVDLPIDGVLYTTKAFWEEAILAKLPSLGDPPGFELVAGDLIEVKVQVPYKTVADVYYGKDNVIIKYIGMVYTDLNTAKDADLLVGYACR